MIPDLPAGTLVRPDLLARLAEGANAGKRLTLIRGGPGTGKTTLVAAYAAGFPGPALWFGLTPAETDGVVFFRQLVEGLKGLLEGLPGQAAGILEALGEAGLGQAAGILCDELAACSASPIAILLDDCQYLPATGRGLEAVETFIRLLPDDVQVVLAGRSFPPLGLAQLQLRGQLVKVDEADLRFTAAQTASLLALRRGSEPDPSLVAAIQDRTRGWITGIAYALAAGTSEMVASLQDPEVLFEFLSEQVFDRLPADFRAQLLRCAHAPGLDAGTCRPVLDPDTEVFFDRLRDHPTFTAPCGDSLQFHPIFRDFLRRQFGIRLPSRDRSEILGRLAANAACLPDQAIGLYQLAGDWEAAESRLLDAFDDLARAGRSATIRALLDGFPAEWGRASWCGEYVRGELARREGSLAEALDHLGEANRRLFGRDGPDAGELRGRVLASLAAANGARGNSQAQRGFAEQALAVLPSGAGTVRAFCYNTLGLFHTFRNDLEAARVAFTQALALNQEAGDTAGEARNLHNLGLAYGQAGEFDRAATFYRESIRLSEAMGLAPLGLSFANLALCEAYLGRCGNAWEVAERGMRLVEHLVSRRDRAYLLYSLGQIAMRQGELAQALDYFEACLDQALGTGDKPCQGYAYLGQAEVALRRGELRQATLAQERALEILGLDLRDPDAIEPALVQIQIDLAAGRLDAAQALLTHASDLLTLRPDHFRSFIVNGLWRDLCMARGDTEQATARVGMMRFLADRFGYPLALAPAAGDAQRDGPVLELFALGPATCSVEGCPVGSTGRRSGHNLMLLAYLLLNPTGATREALSEVLYPDSERTTSAFHMVINRLRRFLEPDMTSSAQSRFILFQDGRYLFNKGVRCRFDVLEFRRLVRQAREAGDPAAQLALLEAAAGQYRGHFLEEFQALPWCMLEAESLRRQVREVYEQRFARHGEADEWHRLEQCADAALALDRGFEAAYRARMVALALQDRPDDALRLARLADQVLARELGTTLAPETRELVEAIEGERLTVRTARSLLPPAWS